MGEANSSTRITRLNVARVGLNQGKVRPALQKLGSAWPWFVQTMGSEQCAVVQAIDFMRAKAMSSLGRSQQAVEVLPKQDHKRLAQAATSLDWEWQLQADRGRALIVNGQRELGLAMLKPALVQMEAAGIEEWIKANYRKLLACAAQPGSPSP